MYFVLTRRIIIEREMGYSVNGPFYGRIPAEHAAASALSSQTCLEVTVLEGHQIAAMLKWDTMQYNEKLRTALQHAEKLMALPS